MPGRWQISPYPALTSLLHSKCSGASVESCPRRLSHLTPQGLMLGPAMIRLCTSIRSHTPGAQQPPVDTHAPPTRPAPECAPALFPKSTWTALPSFHSSTWDVLKQCSHLYLFLVLFFISQFLKCLILLFLSHFSPVLGSFLLPFFYLALLFSPFQSPLAYFVSLFRRLFSINVLILYFTLFLCLISYFPHILYICLYLSHFSFSIPFYYPIPSH